MWLPYKYPVQGRGNASCVAKGALAQTLAPPLKKINSSLSHNFYNVKIRMSKIKGCTMVTFKKIGNFALYLYKTVSLFAEYPSLRYPRYVLGNTANTQVTVTIYLRQNWQTLNGNDYNSSRSLMITL